MVEFFAALILWLPLMWIATSLHDISHSLRSLRGSTRDDIRRLINIHTPTRGPQP
jgi:hypothetical protein